MLREKPDLFFVFANHFAHERVVGSRIAVLFRIFSENSRLFQNDFVRVDQAGKLNVGGLATTRRTLGFCYLSNILRHRDGSPAQTLNSLGESVGKFSLNFVVNVEEQMELVKSGARNLPVMF